MSPPLSPQEALAQAKQRAKWETNIPRRLDAGNPPAVDPAVVRAGVAVGWDWLLETDQDDATSIAKWEDVYRQTKRQLERRPPA